MPKLTEYLPIKLSADLMRELETEAERRGYKVSTLARHLIATGLVAMRNGQPQGQVQPLEPSTEPDCVPA